VRPAASRSAVSTPPVPHSRTVLADEDVAVAVEALRSGQIAESERTRELERTVAAQLGLRHAWATAGGTAALYCALRCMRIGAGDEVLVPTYVCDDVLSAVLQAGATPVPVDVDPVDLNPDPADAAARCRPRTRAVVLAHVLGMPARLDAFACLGPDIIEDCAHGVGGTLPEGPAGSAGRCAILSFHALKMVTGGLGGMVVTDDDGLAAAYDRLLHPDFAAGEYRLHSRMSGVLASVALSQLCRLDATVERRGALARRYQDALADLHAVRALPIEHGDGRRSSCYRLGVVLDEGMTVDEVEPRFRARGVIVRRPVKQLCHRALGLNPGAYPQAEALFDRIVSLPLYPSLTVDEQDRVIDAAREVLA
jgi:perosamine synthetase